MSYKLPGVFFSTVICLASPVMAQTYKPGTEPMEEHLPPSVDLPPEPEAKAEGLRQDGKCQQAIPIFRALAAQGYGYELSQYYLGLCLLDVSKAQTDAQRATSLKHEAAGWIIKAANSGLPNAEKSLVAIYLNGDGVNTDSVEAGKWSLIYHTDGQRLALGLPDISPDLQARLNSLLTEKTWVEAQSRASAWSPVTQPHS
jgi:TPR repeat protein